MTTEEVIQQFIYYIGDNTMTEDEVNEYFVNLGIEPAEILGWLNRTPGIHNVNGKVWFNKGIVKMPPNQPH